MDLNTRTAAPRAGSRTQGGITLLELMIVVAVVGILAAIAYPSYQDSVRKSNRAEAKALLADAAARQERHFSDCNSYTDVIVAPGGCTGCACGLGFTSTDSENGFYTLTAGAGPSGDLATSFAMTATAQGRQAADAQCATFTINSLGQKTASGADCW